jgi:RHS repeat-associated protein
VDASAHKNGAADSSGAYAYDASSNVSARTIGGQKVSYAYNADGELASVTTIKPGKKAVPLETDYGYDAAGNLVRTTLPNGVIEDRSYDRAGRLVSIHATNANGVSVFGADYTLDPAGNPVSAVFDKPSGAERDESYTYDALDRLTGYCVTAGCKGENKIAYSYDQTGNRLTETVGKSVTRYAYDSDSELLSQTLPDGTKIPFSYDANGNETQAGPWSFSYNLANELKQATNGATAAAYSYDGDGNRLAEQVSGSMPETTRYLWDSNFGLPQLAGEQNASGTTLRSYVYGNGPLALIDSGTTYRYYTTDRLGSIRATTGPAGGVRDRGSYMPFGGALANGGGAITNDSNPLAFTGQYLDPVTGLYDMRARNYDPSVGRFTSTDLLGPHDAPVASIYGYARNNPLRFVDPSGLDTWGVCASTGAVFDWLGVGGSGCIQFGPREIGVSATEGGGGASGGGYFFGFGIQHSNADCISDLRGPFVNTGGSAGVIYGGTVDYSVGSNDKGRAIHVGQIGFGESTGLESHLHGTVTETRTFFGSCQSRPNK